ncbi:MAG TPA: hypothetical protein VL742_01980 [Casimicrobiaceae bacterium]|nr:hypothetical protein [Casimicrobiaceae bacterium]
MMGGARGLAFAALVAAGCSTPAGPYRLDGPRTGAGVALAAYAVREECFMLGPGERIDYYFTSTAPVAFNLHYQDANAVVMPIERKGTRAASGDFVADREEAYCLTWEAGAEGALLDYRIRRLP